MMMLTKKPEPDQAPPLQALPESATKRVETMIESVARRLVAMSDALGVHLGGVSDVSDQVTPDFAAVRV